MNNTTISEEKNKDVEIDILALGKKVLDNKKVILISLVISLIVGVVISFSIPKEYETSVILTPDAQSSGMTGNMGALASLAGINLNNASSEDALTSPELYPDIIKSTPFLKGLFNIKVRDEKQAINTTLYDYLENKQDYPWWGYLMKIPSLLSSSSKSDTLKSVKNTRVLSNKELAIIYNLQNRITIATEKKTGVTTVLVTMQSPEISGYLADTITSYLQTYIINYRTQKARNDLEYAEKLYKESKEDYYKAQKDLAAFLDGNLNLVSARYGTTKERLQNEADLTYSVYNQTAQQLQMAKIKVQNTTPVFTIIQPAIEPTSPAKPSKKLIVVGFLFFGFIGSVLWIIRKDIWGMLMSKEQYN